MKHALQEGWTSKLLLWYLPLSVSVLVVAILYRRAKFRDTSRRECDQFSDIASTSSRSSASTSSTISSTRSTRSHVPDKMDIISFNAEGNLRKSVSNTDDSKLEIKSHYPSVIVFFRSTTVMICTAWIATTSWAVWRTYQYKYDNTSSNYVFKLL